MGRQKQSFPFPTWERLTKAEATNYLITRLIVGGFDPRNELVIDGDPGSFFERAARKLDIDWGKCFPEPGKGLRPDQEESCLPMAKIFLGYEIIEMAQQVGYQGDTVRGIVDYLRSLPDKGPIGTKRTQSLAVPA